MSGALLPVKRRLPAAHEAVDALCAELRGGLLAGLLPKDAFAVELLLRETLLNAVVHGAKHRQAAEIQCEVRPVAGGMEIRVTDDGEGFDWHNGWKEEPAPLGESGRGLAILHHYAAEVRFSASGNQVVLKRMFSQGGAHER